MIALTLDELRMVADDVANVGEALLELHRQILADRAGTAPKFAKLVAVWAERRGQKPPAVIHLSPAPADVLDLATTALSDIETFLRSPPQ